MAEGGDNLSNLDDENFFHEGLAHVEELLISSREECIDIGSKYHNLSLKVEDMLHLQEEEESSSANDSGASENFEDAKECSDIKEHLRKYETRFAAYQLNQEHQARIVEDLHLRMDEYRIRNAQLEAALAEHSANEASITETDSHSQNALSMDLDTALIRLEQEKNRCQGLTQINSLLREQLETATEVNQTLTTDIQRLTKEWQVARAKLLAKESEWKEEEQSFSLYFTKESNTLLQMWRQVLNFRHDFANLRSHTERELSTFKVCICNSMQNLNDMQAVIASRPDQLAIGDTIDYTKDVRSQSELEIPRLHERISELIDRNDRIQQLLDEKERANSALCTTVEKINDSLNQSVLRTQPPVKEKRLESLCNQYSKAFEDLSQILQADGNTEISSIFTVIPFTDFSSTEENATVPSSNVVQLQSLVNGVKVVLQKYRKQVEESNLQITSLKDQSVMQERTVEFLEDERQKMQQLNSQLSLQFESLNQRMQSFLTELKTDGSAGSKQTAALETVVKSLKDQVESLQTERNHLITTQSELQSKLQSSNEEKRASRLSELTLKTDLDRSTKKISELEIRLESLRKDYQSSQERLNQLTLDKELLEQEKKKFSSHLSNLETQCLDFQYCLRRLRDEESLVKDSLSTLQNLSDGLCLEKSDLAKALDKAQDELEDTRKAQVNAKIEFEKEKLEWKLKMDKLEYKLMELENERDKLHDDLQSIEDTKQNAEEEKSLLTIRNNDLTNQVTKCTAQKKTLETELEQVRLELDRLSQLVAEAQSERSELSRSVSELGARAEMAEEENQRLSEVAAALEAEKTHLDAALYAAQQEAGRLMDEEKDVARSQELRIASVAALQAQLKDLQAFHEKSVEDWARERDSFLLKIQQIEQDFQITLKNERQQHNADIELLTEEKAALRSRMVSAIDELYERHQKQQDDLISQHQEEVSSLKKQITTHGKDYEEKVLELKDENKKIHSLYKEQISALEHKLEIMKNQISDSEELMEELKDKMANAEQEHQAVMQENTETLKQLKNEINSMSTEHSNEINNLENKIKDLKQEKDSVQYEIQRLELQLSELDSERNKLVKELDERNAYYENEKSSKGTLEERILQLQSQLSEEQTRREIAEKSLEDCKGRLRTAQRNSEELGLQIEDLKLRISEKDAASSRLQSQNAELKSTLKEVERSRQESKREVHSLKRNVSSLEKRLSTREQEVNELNAFHSREEEIQDELKREIVQLKQKLMETSAKSEAASKELASSRQRCSELEHKLQLHKEQEQSLLREFHTSEQGLSEQRLVLEQKVGEMSREVQVLRTSLQSEEGKVLALEGKVVKLDVSKREVENKLFSICLFLRSILGLRTADSGFQSSSVRLHGNSPGPSRGNSSERLAESPRRHNLSKNSSNLTAQLSLSELDVELLKTALVDLVQRFSATEKERDELKVIVDKIQSEAENLRTEHSQCISTIYQLKRELKDKHVLEKELSAKMSSVLHHEETIRNLEREKRKLSEKISNAEFFSSDALKEKENFKEKLSEMRRNESKLQEEISSLISAKESAESRAQKFINAYQALEGELSSLKENLAAKEQKMKSMEQKADLATKKVKSSESRTKSLESTIKNLKEVIERQKQTENLLTQKARELSTSLSQSSTSQLSLSEEMEKKQKESLKYQTELYKAQRSNEQLKFTIDSFELKNETLRQEVADLKQTLMQSEASLQEHREQIRKLQNLLLSSQNSEKEATDQLEHLQEQKRQLEERLKNTSGSLRSTKEQLGEKEEHSQRLEKECAKLKKSLEKAERERSRISETSARSLVERSSLGTSLRVAETENEVLQQKVQTMQAQLSELEERHSQRVKDFLLSQSNGSEEGKLRSLLRQKEQLMEAREKNHRKEVMGLEKQIAVLKEGLEYEKSRWEHYHQRSLSATANINYLSSVLGQSLQKAASDTQRLLPEAERLDAATEAELSVSRDISLTTPSKLRGHGSRHLTSTPKAKRKLDNSKS